MGLNHSSLGGLYARQARRAGLVSRQMEGDLEAR